MTEQPDMVERVARAAYFAGEGMGPEIASAPENNAHWAHCWKVDREAHEAMARAAIEAMREPTGAMCRVGDTAVKDGIEMEDEVGEYESCHYATVPAGMSADVWGDMIDAALAEPVS